MFKNTKTLVFVLFGIVGNVIAFLNFDFHPLFLGGVVVSLILLYATVYFYTKQFDFPLFFVRDELSVWGGLSGGIMGLIGYGFGFILVWGFEPTIGQMIPIYTILFALSMIGTISFTATILSDSQKYMFLNR